MGSVANKIKELAVNPLKGGRDTIKAIGKGDAKTAFTAGIMAHQGDFIAHSKKMGYKQAAPVEEPTPAPTILAGPERQNKQRSLFGY